MNTILITGGELPQYKHIKHLLVADHICVADSGFDWVLENDIEFDMLVGDMDSVLQTNELNKVESNKIIKLPKDKDDTDTVYGLKYLKNIGAKKITLIGGGGGRLDHLLGIFSLLETNISPDVWITKNEIIFNIKGYFSLKTFQGYSVSFFPLNKDVCRINSFGLKWDLSDVDWTYRSIGISNRVDLDDAWIDTGDNSVIVIMPIIGKNFE